MSTEALKPCPFCGAQPKMRTETLDERFAYANQVTVQCQSCGCSRSAVGDTSKPGYANNSTTERRAIEAWNRRAAPAAGAEKDAARAVTQNCWSCKRPYWAKQAADADGSCPHCGVEIDTTIAAHAKEPS